MILLEGSCIGSQNEREYNKNRESSMQGNKIHLEHALAGGYFVSDYHQRLSCLNLLPLTSGMK